MRNRVHNEPGSCKRSYKKSSVSVITKEGREAPRNLARDFM